MRSVFLFCIAAATLAAQAQDADSVNNTRNITAASEFFDHDFVNVFAFANGVWDSRVPIFNPNSNVEGFNSGLGWEAGGGLIMTHTFKDGGITINYRGSYRDYQSAGSNGGQQQTLTLAYDKRLNRHWSFGTNISGAILTYGTSYYSASSIASFTAGNPNATESRFVNAGVSLTYEQTRRLSYVFTGSFLLNSYNSKTGTAVDARGGSGGASALYRLTARTTIGATYSRTYFAYSQNAGTSNIDMAALTLSHRFPDHWQIDLSAGVNHVKSSGTITIPITLLFGTTVLTGYETGPYNRTIYTPVFQGVLTHTFRRSSASVSGGQSVMSGNGLFLTSRDQFVNGAFSFSTRRTNVSFGGNWARLDSLANSISQAYTYYGASGSVGVNLVRYVSANLRYDFLHYDGLFNTSSLSEQRVSFGLSLSSKSVPLTLF